MSKFPRFSQLPMTLRIGLILVGLIMLVGVVSQFSSYMINRRAKVTFLKNFYHQADVADQHGRELSFPNFVMQAPVDGSARGRGVPIKYCSNAGTYFDYQTGKTIPNARTCEKGTARFYWLPALDSQTIDQKIADMQKLGWTLLDANTAVNMQLAKDNILLRDESGRGFQFKRDDGTFASLEFWNRQGHDASNPEKGWCGYDPDCAELKKADTTHQYFMSVSVFAYKDYEQ